MTFSPFLSALCLLWPTGLGLFLGAGLLLAQELAPADQPSAMEASLEIEPSTSDTGIEQGAEDGQEAASEEEATAGEDAEPSSYAAGLQALAELMPLQVKSGQLFAKVESNYQISRDTENQQLGLVWVLEVEAEEEKQRLLSMGLFAAGEEEFYGGGEEIAYADHVQLVEEWLEEKGMWADGEEWEWGRQGVWFGGRELISALIAWQLGEEQLAEQMVESLFAASRNPEHLIDFVVSAFAEYELRGVMDKFEESRDWEQLSTNLQALAKKYSRGWVGFGAAQILAAKAGLMAKGEMVVESQLAGFELDEVKLQRAEELIKGEASSFTLNALFEETAENSLPGGLADLQLLLSLIGCEAFAPLPEEGLAAGNSPVQSYQMEGDYLLYQTAQQSLSTMSSTNPSSWERERYFRDMKRPKTYSEMAEQLIRTQMGRYSSPAEEGDRVEYFGSSYYSGSDSGQELLSELLPLLRKSADVFGASRAALFMEWDETEDSALDYLIHRGEPEQLKKLMVRFGENPLAHTEEVEMLITTIGPDAKELHEKLMAGIVRYEGLDGEKLEQAFRDNEHYGASSQAYASTEDGNWTASYDALKKWGEGLAVHLKELSLEVALEEFLEDRVDESAFAELLAKLQRKEGLAPLLEGVIKSAAEQEEVEKKGQLLEALAGYALRLDRNYAGEPDYTQDALVEDFTPAIESWRILLADERVVEKGRRLSIIESRSVAHYSAHCFQSFYGKVTGTVYVRFAGPNWEKYIAEALTAAQASVDAGELQLMKFPDQIKEAQREELLTQFTQKRWQERLAWVDTISLAEEVVLMEIWQEKGAELGASLPVDVVGKMPFVEQWKGQRGKDFSKKYFSVLTDEFFALLKANQGGDQLAGMYVNLDEEGWGGIVLREMAADEVEGAAEYLEEEFKLSFEKNLLAFYSYDGGEVFASVSEDMKEEERQQAMQPIFSLYFEENGALREDLPRQVFVMPFSAQ